MATKEQRTNRATLAAQEWTLALRITGLTQRIDLQDWDQMFLTIGKVIAKKLGTFFVGVLLNENLPNENNPQMMGEIQYEGTEAKIVSLIPSSWKLPVSENYYQDALEAARNAMDHFIERYQSLGTTAPTLKDLKAVFLKPK
eukprot:Platyproteum_vivax@DN9062_c0_g1_i1.p2